MQLDVPLPMFSELFVLLIRFDWKSAFPNMSAAIPAYFKILYLSAIFHTQKQSFCLTERKISV
jgi:hypothetical protein